MLPCLDDCLHAKNVRYWFLPKILKIKQSCNLFEQETQLATPNQIRQSQTLPLLDDQRHVKNWDIAWFVPDMLTKKPCNLVGQKTVLATQWKMVLSNAAFPWWLCPCKKSKIFIKSSQNYWRSKNPVIWLVERQNWPHPTKSGSLRCHISLMTSSMQKKKSIDSFQRYWSKTPTFWLDKRYFWQYPTKMVV